MLVFYTIWCNAGYINQAAVKYSSSIQSDFQNGSPHILIANSDSGGCLLFFIEKGNILMARTKGAIAAGVDNKAVRAFLLRYISLNELPPVVADCVSGALGQEIESRGFGGERIIAILKQLDYIDTATVHQQMWDYNRTQGEFKEPSKRNYERMTKVLRCASRAIYHHAELWHRKKDKPVEANVCNITEDQRETLHRFVEAGKWSEVQALLNSYGMTCKQFECPVLVYSGDNVVGLESRLTTAPRISAPSTHSLRLDCPHNLWEPVKDKQPDNTFTVKNCRNLQPLIEEVGARYAVAKIAV